MSNKLKRKAAPLSGGSSVAVSASPASSTPLSASAIAEPPPLVPAAKRLEADVDFVCEAIEARSQQGNYQLARCHLALAKCFWRDSFKVRRRAYQLARDEANWDAAAAAFMQMYADNPNEALFYQELSRVLEGVTKADGDAGCSALFGRLPGRLQCELLLKYGQSVGSALEQASLMLYAIQQYPSVAAQQGSPLVEALLAAEQDACEETVLNKHRKCLVVDVLPVLLGGANASSNSGANSSGSASVVLSPKLLRKLLTMSVEFYVALGSAACGAVQQQQALQPLLDSWQLPANPWPAGRQLADGLCRQMGLQLHQLARGQPDSVLSAVWETDASYDSNQTKSLAAVSLLLLAEASSRFYRLARPSSSASDPSSTGHQADEFANSDTASCSPVGRGGLLLHCLRPVADKLQLSSTVAWRREAAKAFLSASHIVRLIRDWPDLQRRLDSLKDRLQRRGLVRLAWLDGIYAEHLLYSGQPGACLKQLRSLAAGPGAWPAEHRLYYEAQCLLLQGAAAASIRPLMACCLALSPSDGSLASTPSAGSPAAAALSDARPPTAAPCLTPLTCGLALRVLVATLADLLVGLAGQLDASGAPDRLIGHCLVLLQRDWPEEDDSQRQRQLDSLLNLIRARSRLDYCPQFADYIIMPEAIEELALLRNSHNVELNLFQSTDTDEATGKKVTGGFNGRMAAQMDRCHENLAELLYKFVRAEEQSLLEFAEQAGSSQ